MPEKQIRYPNTKFIEDVLWPEYCEKHPDATSMCYPRRIVPPYGYLNPKIYAAEMVAFMKDSVRADISGDASSAWTAMLSGTLIQYDVPTYFIDRDFIRAVYESDPPDCRMCDINWPLPAMLFVLPMDFTQEITGGYHFPFLAVANCPLGEYQITHPKLRTMHCPSVTYNNRHRFVFHFPGFFNCAGKDDQIPVDYIASYEITRHVTEMAMFEHFTDWTENKPKEIIPVGQPTREQEIVLNKTMNSLAAKLLLAITACPSSIEKGARLWPKNPPKPGKVLEKPELHSPNFIGKTYSISSRARGESEPTGKVVVSHWRRGHF
jgi:hypothetical protein